MSTLYPGSIDNGTTLPNPSASSPTNNPDHASLHANANDAVKAVETKVGTGASTPTLNNLLIGTGTGTSSWSKVAPTGTIVGTTDTQTLTNKTINGGTISNATISNPTLTVDSVTGFTSSTTGSVYGLSVASGVLSSPTLSGTVGGNLTFSGTMSVNGQPTFQGTTAPPAAGANTAGIKVSSTANLGIFFGSGAPTFSAAQGSLYIRTDGSSTTTRAYVNTNGSTTWTYLTAGA